MLNYKMSLSVLCKGAESEYKLTATEINPRESTKATILNLLNLTPFFFSVYKNFKNLQENVMGQIAFVPLG